MGKKRNFKEDSLVYTEYVGLLIEGNRGSVFYVVDEKNCPIRDGSTFVVIIVGSCVNFSGKVRKVRLNYFVR